MHNCVQLSMTSLISMSTLFSTSLVTLELASCKLARQAGIILSQSLQSCTTLRRLLLADNNLRDGGLRAIIDALRVSPGMCGAHSTHDESEPPYRANEATRLDELDISRNGISSSGFGALSQVSIRHVHAAGNAIESIGPFLFTNLATESLDLADNALSDDGVHELVNTLFREQTSLQELDLRGCGLSEQSVKFLCAAVQQSSCCPLWKLLLDLPVAFDGTMEAEPSVSHLLLKEMINAAAAKYPQFQIIVDSQHVDVECIVSKTIECMNRNFEQRLGQFLAKMETQQHDKNASQVQFLAAKVDACERAIPRLEARLDTLSDRVTASQTQLSKLQNGFQMQLQQVQQEIAAVRASSMAATTHHAPSFNAPLTATTPLSIVMHNQVDELVTLKVRASEQVARNEIQKLRCETNPQTIVDAVSGHLAQFKQEVDANQSNVLCRFTESLAKDSIRLDERMLKMETQLGHLDSVIQAEQQASLLALEAISDAFAGNNNNPEGI
uniref:Uncharacterized protein n=1 Tax=Globisporangium ultimum (strain ATCC 200006 / CBS 805.95 / DAOM BR144) TaxID=431595 RepID=K3WXD4_GLOUD